MEQTINFIRDKLIEQGGQSVKSTLTTTCQYRGDNGRKCAIGWLIEDSEYQESFEGEALDYFGEVRTLIESKYSDSDIKVLCILQFIHDKYFESVTTWQDYINIMFDYVINNLDDISEQSLTESKMIIGNRIDKVCTKTGEFN